MDDLSKSLSFMKEQKESDQVSTAGSEKTRRSRSSDIIIKEEDDCRSSLTKITIESWSTERSC